MFKYNLSVFYSVPDGSENRNLQPYGYPTLLQIEHKNLFKILTYFALTLSHAHTHTHIHNKTSWLIQGPSINDVTALGGRGYRGFCDNSSKALLIKSVTMRGGGVKNYEKLRDVIYGRPLNKFTMIKPRLIENNLQFLFFPPRSKTLRLQNIKL